MYKHCDLCRFSYFPTTGSMSEWGGGYCHRYAPRPILEKDFDDAKHLDEVVRTIWPIVTTNDWCGEFKPPKG